MQNVDLQKRLEEIEKADGMVPVAEVRELLVAVRELFEGGQAGEVSLGDELSDLAGYINAAKSELRAFADMKLADKEIPDASDQLDAVVKATEAATDQIMDACESMERNNTALRQRLLDVDPPLDPDVLASVDDMLGESQKRLTNIFEACNFQDLTGQRIQKIVSTLRNIEQQVLRMVILFGMKQSGEATTEAVVQERMEEARQAKESGSLENGPQLPGQGLEQDDVDALLAKLL